MTYSTPSSAHHPSRPWHSLFVPIVSETETRSPRISCHSLPLQRLIQLLYIHFSFSRSAPESTAPHPLTPRLPSSVSAFSTPRLFDSSPSPSPSERLLLSPRRYPLRGSSGRSRPSPRRTTDPSQGRSLLCNIALSGRRACRFRRWGWGVCAFRRRIQRRRRGWWTPRLRPG